MVDIQNHAVIEFTADGSEFVLTNVEVDHQLDRELLISGGLSSLTPNFVQLVAGLNPGDDSESFDVDAGQGEDVISIDAEIVPSVEDDFVWQGTDTVATNADRFTQAEVLQRTARTVSADSDTPVRLYWGPLSDGTKSNSGSGPLDPFEGTVQSVTTRHPRDDPSRFTVSLDLRRTGDENPAGGVIP